MLEKVKPIAEKELRTKEIKTNVSISPPNFQIAKIKIKGTAPFVMNKMSSDNRKAMIDKQEAGSGAARKGRKLPPRDFDRAYRGAMHVSREGWYGIPASAFRAAMISACRVVGFKMTQAKLCLFVEPDGFDADDGQPLVKLVGKPVRRDMATKNADGGTTITARPFFDDWSAEVRLRWDADVFNAGDVLNLLSRVGGQVGIGAGRPDSKTSTGMGWGLFEVQS